MSSRNAGCMGFLFGLFGQAEPEAPAQFPYRLRDDFMSKAELSLYGVLRLVAADRLVVCPKIRLGDIFYVPGGAGAQSNRNRLQQKHVDFLLCDPQTLRPLVGVELDDKSHERGDGPDKDLFKDKVFQAAGLPLLRIPARASYSVEEVGAALRAAVTVKQAVAQPAATAKAAVRSTAGAPICPKCGTPMVPRQSRHDGKRFYGCANYPRCNQMAPMPE